ncbi:hypothetical protein ACFQ61_10135 [Streptomyces sp. NPDC056500]|uniref:hypothetical protein n=1 Tax=Streptomyces sp. NPDC056500 TaxID=3345840 RepID=UPI00369A91A0
MRVWVAIWTGSTLISRRIAAWLAHGILLRLGGILLAAGFIKGLPWTTRIAWATAVIWLVTAITLGLNTSSTDTEEQGEGDELAPESLTAALHHLAAPHVHLAALAEHLGTTTDTIRTTLTQMRVPIAGGVRMDGRGVSTGVRAQDLPPLPQPLPPASEGPLTSDNNSNNTLTVEKREGMSIIRRAAESVARHTTLTRST